MAVPKDDLQAAREIVEQQPLLIREAVAILTAAERKRDPRR